MTSTMSGYTISDINSIRPTLNGYTPDGKQLNKSIDHRPPRYMILLYAAANFATFEHHCKGDRGKRGFTLYSLKTISKSLQLDFDRTKSSLKVYDDQEKKDRIKKRVGKNTTYNLTKKGTLHCEECIKNFLQLCEIPPSAWESHTESASKKLDLLIAKVQKMSEKEQEIWFKKNPGVLFAQALIEEEKEEHKLDLLLQKIKSLS